jgi:hypothetical protein
MTVGRRIVAWSVHALMAGAFAALKAARIPIHRKQKLKSAMGKIWGELEISSLT